MNFDIKILQPAQRQIGYIKKNYPDFYTYIEENYPKDISFKEKLYWYEHNITTYPICPQCGKRLVFTHKYGIFCSQDCANKSSLRTQKSKLTRLERYGDENYNNMPKNKQTCLEKYGVDSYRKTQECKDQIKQTKLERYGDENYANTQKYKQTCLERYGVDNASKSQKIKDLIKQTFLEKYGVEHALQNKEIKEKAQQTCLERYGVTNYNQSQQSKDRYKDEEYVSTILKKQKQTCLDKYGVDNYAKTQECKDKVKQTCLERYGVEHYDNVYKSKQTCLERYGVEYYTQTNEFYNKWLISQYNTKKKNGTFNTSQIEQQFKKWLDDNKIEYKYQYKDDKYPFVCDFYFPFKDLYLEIQGSWTHGGHPFDPSNKEDIKTLNKWKEKNTKFYNNAIETWTIRDVRKREMGKNLNWKEVFTNDLNELIDIFKDTYDTCKV